MNTKTTPTIRFTRDADGVWGVLAPIADAKPGATLTATRRDGTLSQVTIATVSDTPKTDGTVFCWISATSRATVTTPRRTAKPATTKIRRTSRHTACVTGGNCSSTGNGHCGGHNCDANWG